jgi:hypothetical protein
MLDACFAGYVRGPQPGSQSLKITNPPKRVCRDQRHSFQKETHSHSIVAGGLPEIS